MPTAPDYTTDSGVTIWLDVTADNAPCDLVDVAPDYDDTYPCTGAADRRYGDVHACRHHYAAAAARADEDAYVAAADTARTARLDA